MNISQFVLVAPAGARNRKAKIKIKKSFGLSGNGHLLSTYTGEDMNIRSVCLLSVPTYQPINV
jgi:hypothetical protein